MSTQLDHQTALGQPDLAFVRGLCAFMQQHNDALVWLDDAYRGHEAAGDARACLRDAAAALVCSVLDVGSMSNSDTWTRRFALHDADGTQSVCAFDRAWRHMGHVSAGLLSDCITPAVEDSAEWLQQQLGPRGLHLTTDERLMAACVLVNYGLQVKRPNEFDIVRAVAEFPRDFDAASPLMRATWLYTYGFAKYHVTDHNAAEPAWERAATVSEKPPLGMMRFACRLALMRLAIDRGDLARAQLLNATIDPTWGGGRESQLALLFQMRARLALLEGAPASTARSLLEQARATAEKAGMPVSETATYGADLIQIQVALGEFEDALALARSLALVHKDRNGDVFRSYDLLIGAWLLRSHDVLKSRRLLSEGLALAQAINFRMFFRLHPAFAAELCAWGLNWAVERQLLREVITVRSLRAPPSAAEHWPWTYWVQLLGGYQLRVNAVPRPVGRMSKHVELLWLLACQTTLQIAQEKAAESLWPGDNETPQTRRKKLEEAIRLLRALLLDPNTKKDADSHRPDQPRSSRPRGQAPAPSPTSFVVVVADDQVQLNPGTANSDVRCRRLLINELKSMESRAVGLAPGVTLPGIADAVPLVYRIRALSQGELLPGWDSLPWVVDERRRCNEEMRLASKAIAALLARGLTGLEPDVLG